MSISQTDWVIGIALSVLGSVVGGSSKLAIRKSFLIEEALSLDEDYDDVTIERRKRLALAMRGFGWLGMATLNPLCGVLAMGYASPSIVAPFAGMEMVWIILFSNTCIGEQASNRQVVAACLIVLGEVVVAVYGDHTNDEGKTIEDVVHSNRDPAFVAYLIGMVVWMVLLVHWMNNAKGVVRRFAWGVAGGSLTGMSNFLKDSLTILKRSDFPALPWLFYFFFGMAITTALGGLQLLTMCMKRYDVTYSSAMFIGSFVVSASIMSVAHYRTFANLSDSIDFLMYPLGLLMMIAGVWILVQQTELPTKPGQSPTRLSPQSAGVDRETSQLVGKLLIRGGNGTACAGETEHLQARVGSTYGGV